MNDLVARNTNSLSTAKDDWGGLIESVTSLTIRCDLGQPMSQGGKEAGKFNFSNPEWKPQDILQNVVICHPMKTRVLFGKALTDPRRCGSENFVTPSPFIKEPISKTCGECPLGKWDSDLMMSEDVEKKRLWEKTLGKKEAQQPLCNATINLIVMDDRKVPYILKFQKTQIKVVTEQLINRIIYKGKRPYQVMFDIGTKPGDARKGKFFENTFDNFRDISEEDVSEYQSQFNFFKANGERLMAENINQMDQEKEVSSFPNPEDSITINDNDEIPF